MIPTFFLARFLIYLFPVFINLVIGSLLLIVPTRLSAAGASSLTVTATLSSWAFVTAIASFLIGIRVHKDNCSAMIRTACLLFLVCFLGLLCFQNLLLQFFWLALAGVATGFFCAPFQIFMKKAEHGRDAGIVRATAMYSVSWSFGMGSGPFLVAVFAHIAPQRGWMLNLALNVLLCAILAFLVRPLERKNESLPPPPEPSSSEGNAPLSYSGRPDWAFLGWVLTCGAFTAANVIKSYLPAFGPGIRLTEWNIGLIIALIYYTHSFVSLLLIRSRDWMYRPMPMLFLSLAGSIGLLVFSVVSTPSMLYFAALCLGAYSGFTGFLLVFYSLVHPSNAARYVAVNEIVVGMSGIFGPFLLGGCLSEWIGTRAPFVACLLLVLSAGAIHFRVSRRYTRSLKPAR